MGVLGGGIAFCLAGVAVGGNDIRDPRNDNRGGASFDIVRVAAGTNGAIMRHEVELDGRFRSISPTIYVDSPRSPGRNDFAIAVVGGRPGVYRLPGGNYVGPAEQIAQGSRQSLWKFDVREIGCPGRYEWAAAMLSRRNQPRDRAPDEEFASNRGNWLC